MYTDTTDTELMAALARQKDGAAMKEIIHRYQKLVWKVALRFTSSVDDSKDIVQDTFIRLWESSNRYKPTAFLSTFIFHIVTNVCLDFKKKKRPVGVESIDSFEDSGSTGDRMEKKENSRRLAAALHTLPKRQRLAIIYKYEYALSVRDIAEIMKTSEKSVERLLYHGREKLRNVLKNI